MVHVQNIPQLSVVSAIITTMTIITSIPIAIIILITVTT